MRQDGYRIHHNGDGTFLFVEGSNVIPCRTATRWTKHEEQKLKECLKRRGLNKERKPI